MGRTKVEKRKFGGHDADCMKKAVDLENNGMLMFLNRFISKLIPTRFFVLILCDFCWWIQIYKQIIKKYNTIVLFNGISINKYS